MAIITNIYRYLDTDGDGTGTKNANVDGSDPAVEFKITATEAISLHRMMVKVEDGGSLSAGTYGALAALSTGVTVKFTDAGGDITDLTDGLPIKTNAAWGQLCYDVVFHTFGAGNNFLLVRWTFSKSGKPLILETGDKLSVFVNDDLTGLVSHHFQVQGIKGKG